MLSCVMSICSRNAIDGTPINSTYRASVIAGKTLLGDKETLEKFPGFRTLDVTTATCHSIGAFVKTLPAEGVVVGGPEIVRSMYSLFDKLYVQRYLVDLPGGVIVPFDFSGWRIEDVIHSPWCFYYTLRRKSR